MPTLVVSLPPAGDAYAEFTRLLLEELRHARGAELLCVPHAYYLDPAHPAARALAAAEPLTVCARLYPRATEWTIKYLTGKREADVRALDARTYGDDFRACAAACLQLAGLTRADEATVEPRIFSEAAPTRWRPVIDYNRCAGCGQCLDFCLFGVYAPDAGGVRVADPDRCKPGCPACARVCPAGAILFPECGRDDAVAGKPGAEIARAATPDAARAFARDNIADYRSRQPAANTAPPSPAAPGDDHELDRLIDELDKLENPGR